MYQQYKTILLCVKCAFVGVMNEYFSEDARNKQCRNVTAIVKCETIRVFIIGKLEESRDD
jgi:hypothetical protein